MARTFVVSLLVALAFTACGWDWTVVPKSGSADAGEAGISADGTCASNAECRSEEYCAFADGRCGAGVRGFCQPTPFEKECSDPLEPPYVACGCDGKTASNACRVEQTRTDLAAEGACTAPPDTFRCGYFFCPKTAFCFESQTPKGSYKSCGEWPCAADRSCACKDPIPKCPTATCSTDADGNALVVCTEEGQ